MKVLIATDIHLHIIDGHWFLAKQIYYIIKRYHDYFGDIILYCRKDTSDTKEELITVDDIVCEHICFNSLFGTMCGADKKKLEEGVKRSNLVIGRFHSFSACEAAMIAKKQGIPFLAEVMGDAWDGYWNHGLSGKLIAPFIYFRTKIAIKNAEYGLYVTEHYLQEKYPCKGKTISASNVQLEDVPETVLEKKFKKIENIDRRNISLLTAANVDVRAKGHEYVIKSIPILKRKGISAEYYIAGGGDKAYLEGIAKKYGVEKSVHFLGRLTADGVKDQMDSCDIYIQPSLQEGLPRSVIEAMSRGCPCCGAKTAGIPELLQDECVFKRGSEKDIANIIMRILKLDLYSIATYNYHHSKLYVTDILNKRREEFFSQIRKEIQV